jgi:hypothetical protein
MYAHKRSFWRSQIEISMNLEHPCLHLHKVSATNRIDKSYGDKSYVDKSYVVNECHNYGQLQQLSQLEGSI